MMDKATKVGDRVTVHLGRGRVLRGEIVRVPDCEEDFWGVLDDDGAFTNFRKFEEMSVDATEPIKDHLRSVRESAGTPYSVLEARLVALNHPLDIYHKEIIIFLCDRVEELERLNAKWIMQTNGQKTTQI